jgi:hypothetical protein
MVTGVDRTDPWSRRPVQDVAGPHIYQGTSGIALFLIELFTVTRETKLKRTIDGALRYAISHAWMLTPTQFGFHSGLVGIGYALSRYASVFQEDSAAASARALTENLGGREHLDERFDVINGAAGAIPVLLNMADELAAPKLHDSATALGEHLMRTARRWPIGWSWHTNMGAVARDLTGLAHGAAGCGHALLELYHRTGRSSYRYGADQAFAYEREFFDPKEENWPDLRNDALNEALSTAKRAAQLRARLRAGDFSARYTQHSMIAWCHGAPGIALTRLRAYELLRDERYRQEAEAGIRTSLSSPSQSPNYSLCHGRFGNDVALLQAAFILGNESLADVVANRAMEATERFELADMPWPSGAIGSVPDPSLMLGDAGIGYHLLSLYRREVPSILLPVTRSHVSSSKLGRTADAHDRTTKVADGLLLRLRSHGVAQYFGRTLRILERLDASAAALVRDALSDDPSLDVVLTAAAIRHILASSAHEESVAMLEDASGVDFAHFYLATAISDFSDTLIEDLLREPASELDLDSLEFSLKPCVRLVEQRYDWESWLEKPDVEIPPAELPAPIAVLVHRRADEVREQRLAPLSQVVLSALRTPQMVREVARIVECTSTRDGIAADQLAAATTKQLIAAYEAGILNANPRAVSAGSG